MAPGSDPAPAAAGAARSAPGAAPETPRRALVTGGAIRVGRAISLALGRAGWDVALHFHSSSGEAESLAAELREAGREVLLLPADLGRPEGVERLFDDLGARWERIDLLVNNAAIFPRGRPEEVDVETWDRVFALDVRAPFLCARRAAALMRDGGTIVNIADVAAFEGWPGYVAYAATQAALISLTRSLALAWAPGIRVNAVAPGAVLLPEDATGEERRGAARRSALGRVGRPEDVAGAVLYLAGADYVTGEVIRVDGGSHIARPRPPEAGPEGTPPG